jgi:hypothetical protein
MTTGILVSTRPGYATRGGNDNHVASTGVATVWRRCGDGVACAAGGSLPTHQLAGCRLLALGDNTERDRAVKANERSSMFDVQPFTALFIAHVPDADPRVHRSEVATDKYRSITVLVQNTDQAIDVSRELVASAGVQSIILCPGNSNEDVARVSEAVGEGVGVSVARGDARSMRVATEAMRAAGWF